MAQPYKPKRRRPSGPNKNQKKVQRDQEASDQTRAAGLLSQVFPSVEKLTVHLDFLTPQQHLMDQQKRVFTPADVCDFSVPCPGRCGHGSFNLSAKVKSVIDSRETRSEGNGTCMEPTFLGAKELCDFRLRCRIEVDYLPE